MNVELYKATLEASSSIDDIPRDLKDYLQVSFNPGFLMWSGTTKSLKEKGYSESYIAGFLAGTQHCSELLDQIIQRGKQDEYHQ